MFWPLWPLGLENDANIFVGGRFSEVKSTYHQMLLSLLFFHFFPPELLELIERER